MFYWKFFQMRTYITGKYTRTNILQTDLKMQKLCVTNQKYSTITKITGLFVKEFHLL